MSRVDFSLDAYGGCPRWTLTVDAHDGRSRIHRTNRHLNDLIIKFWLVKFVFAYLLPAFKFYTFGNRLLVHLLIADFFHLKSGFLIKTLAKQFTVRILRVRLADHPWWFIRNLAVNFLEEDQKNSLSELKHSVNGAHRWMKFILEIFPKMMLVRKKWTPKPTEKSVQSLACCYGQTRWPVIRSIFEILLISNAPEHFAAAFLKKSNLKQAAFGIQRTFTCHKRIKRPAIFKSSLNCFMASADHLSSTDHLPPIREGH